MLKHTNLVKQFQTWMEMKGYSKITQSNYPSTIATYTASFLKICEEIADQADEYRIIGSFMFAAAYTLYYIGLMHIASPLGKNETGISDVVYDVAYNLKKYINEDGELILTIPDIRSETNKLIRCALDTENNELLDAVNIMRDISPCEYYRKRIDHIPSDEQLKNAVKIIASEEEKSKPGSYGDLFAKKLREILANNDNFRSSTLKISKCMFDYYPTKTPKTENFLKIMIINGGKIQKRI